MSTKQFYIEFLDENSIVSVTDQKGNIIYVNNKFCEISKYSEDELLGQNHRIINSGFHSPDFFKEMWKTIANGKSWRGEICNRAKDGSLYWVESFIKPEIGDDGKPISYYSFRLPITDRKFREEEQFYQTVSQLGSLFENSQGYQFFVDRNHTLISLNKSATTIPGITKGIKACSCDEESTDNNLNNFIENFDSNLKKALSGIEIKIEQEVDFLNTGKKEWYLITFYPIMDGLEKVIGVSLSAINIHQKKLVELDLKSAYETQNALIESVAEPVFFKDGHGRWITINKAASDLFEMDGFKWQGKTDLEMAEERDGWRGVYEFCHNSDEEVWALGMPLESTEHVGNNEFIVTKYPIFYEDGRRKGMVIFSRNVTESKIQIEKLKKHREQLLRISWLQAHKARAPVARILGLANIFNFTESHDPINKEIIKRMVECANNLDDVIHTIMNYAEEEEFYTTQIQNTDNR